MGKVGFSPPCDFKELGVAKRSRSTTSARSALRQPWSIIARTNIFEGPTNLNVVQPKLFQATRQDDLRFSDCTVSVIQILDDADAAFRILCGWTVLSATIMFADKPHRLNERTSAQRFCVLTILPPVPHSRLGYPRSGLSRSDFVLWHISDLSAVQRHVWNWGKTGSNRTTVKMALMTQLRHPTSTPCNASNPKTLFSGANR